MCTCDSYDLDGLRVVSVTGDVDLATADHLWSAVEPHLIPSPRLVGDCARIEFMNSVGLEILLRAKRTAEAVGTTFGLAALSPAVTRVLHLAGAEGLFSVYQDLAHCQSVSLGHEDLVDRLAAADAVKV